MKIILAQYFEIFQISSSGKIYNKNIITLLAYTPKRISNSCNFIMFLLRLRYGRIFCLEFQKIDGTEYLMGSTELAIF